MEQQVVVAQERDNLGKTATKLLRAKGLVPGTVYGASKDPISVTVEKRELIKVYRGPKGRNALISLQINGGVTESVISYRIDRNPLSLEIEHVDFLRLDPSKPVKVVVPLKLVGVAPGVKLGGMMMQNFSSITISAVPSNIPECVEVDLSNLGVNQGIKVKSLENDQFKIESNRELVIVQVNAKGGKAAAEGEQTRR